MNTKSIKKVLFLCFVLLALIGLYVFDISEYLTLSFLKIHYEELVIYYKEHRYLSGLIFLLIYITVVAASIPGAVILTLGAGAIFGFWYGLLLVSFASTIGATLSFLSSRYLFKDFIQNRFKKELKKINKGVEENGASYLFSLRLIPAFPFFMINLMMGLTNMKIWTYIWVSQIGMLAGTMVYINAGLELSKVTSISGILDLKLIASFGLLALFPLIVKIVIRTKKEHSKF